MCPLGPMNTIITWAFYPNNSYGTPTSTNFLFLSSNLCHGNSVISTLCIVSHCFFRVSRDQPSSNFMPSPGILARMLNPVIQESINSLLSTFYFRPPWSSTLRMQSHTYSPDPFQYMLASICWLVLVPPLEHHPFPALSISEHPLLCYGSLEWMSTQILCIT